MNSDLKYRDLIYLDELREVKDDNLDNYLEYETVLPEGDAKFKDILIKFNKMVLQVFDLVKYLQGEICDFLQNFVEIIQ